MTDDERWEYDVIELMQNDGITRAAAEMKLQKRAQQWIDAKKRRDEEPTKQ